jgi:hypothetical protein
MPLHSRIPYVIIFGAPRALSALREIQWRSLKLPMSFRRKPESIIDAACWTPAFTGVTVSQQHCRSIHYDSSISKPNRKHAPASAAKTVSPLFFRNRSQAEKIPMQWIFPLRIYLRAPITNIQRLYRSCRKPEKGIPPERVGRKATGLNPCGIRRRGYQANAPHKGSDSPRTTSNNCRKGGAP